MFHYGYTYTLHVYIVCTIIFVASSLVNMYNARKGEEWSFCLRADTSRIECPETVTPPQLQSLFYRYFRKKSPSSVKTRSKLDFVARFPPARNNPLHIQSRLRFDRSHDRANIIVRFTCLTNLRWFSGVTVVPGHSIPCLLVSYRS